MKLWQKDYSLDELVEDYTVGNDYKLDKRLVKYDCEASIAHAKMLNKIGVLSEEEKDLLVDELQNIIEIDKEGEFEIKKSDEDCHTAIENHLIEELGEPGKKIHTGRSRNDQVLTALRLYYRAEMDQIVEIMKNNVSSIEEFVNEYGEIEIPGYTHTRKAMPSSVKMWAEGLKDSMEDNISHLDFYKELTDQSPLGTAAGYGSPLDLDREYTAKELDFTRVQENPVYCQNSRGKFGSGLINILGQIMYDLNKYATDLILFSMPGCSYFNLPDEFLTGSSIMPQKKNPDVLELLRANYHKVISMESRIKSMMANLITGYHRDSQLYKEAVFGAIDITKASLEINDLVFSSLEVDAEACEQAMTDELFATERAYELVKNGMAFRTAYRKIAEELEEEQKKDS